MHLTLGNNDGGLNKIYFRQIAIKNINSDNDLRLKTAYESRNNQAVGLLLC